MQQLRDAIKKHVLASSVNKSGITEIYLFTMSNK